MPRFAIRVVFVSLVMTAPAIVSGQDAAGISGRADTTGTISGIAWVAGTTEPLAYATVSLPDQHLERFADTNGHFVFLNVVRGSVTVRVQRIGFTPATVTVKVEAGKITPVEVRLDRVVLRLDAVQVTTHPACTKPGRPTAKGDQILAAVFDQLMQNANGSRLLLTEYPYRTLVERRTSLQVVNGADRPTGVDTILRLGDHSSAYAPGHVVIPHRHGTISYYAFDLSRGSPFDGTPVATRDPPPVYDVLVPELIDLASDAFVANHCFWYDGQDMIGGQSLIHIEFAAAERMRDPDIEGAIYLDPRTFVIHQTSVRLTKIPPAMNEVGDMTVTSIFTEVLPGVPVANDISSVTSVRAGTDTTGVISSTESQHMLTVWFLKSRP